MTIVVDFHIFPSIFWTILIHLCTPHFHCNFCCHTKNAVLVLICMFYNENQMICYPKCFSAFPNFISFINKLVSNVVCRQNQQTLLVVDINT